MGVCEGTCYRAEHAEPILLLDLRPVPQADGALMCPTCRRPYRCDGECREVFPLALTVPEYGARYCLSCAVTRTADQEAGEWTPEDEDGERGCACCPGARKCHSDEGGMGGRVL